VAGAGFDYVPASRIRSSVGPGASQDARLAAAPRSSYVVHTAALVRAPDCRAAHQGPNRAHVVLPRSKAWRSAGARVDPSVGELSPSRGHRDAAIFDSRVIDEKTRRDSSPGFPSPRSTASTPRCRGAGWKPCAAGEPRPPHGRWMILRRKAWKTADEQGSKKTGHVVVVDHHKPAHSELQRGTQPEQQLEHTTEQQPIKRPRSRPAGGAIRLDPRRRRSGTMLTRVGPTPPSGSCQMWYTRLAGDRFRGSLGGRAAAQLTERSNDPGDRGHALGSRPPDVNGEARGQAHAPATMSRTLPGAPVGLRRDVAQEQPEAATTLIDIEAGPQRRHEAGLPADTDAARDATTPTRCGRAEPRRRTDPSGVAAARTNGAAVAVPRRLDRPARASRRQDVHGERRPRRPRLDRQPRLIGWRSHVALVGRRRLTADIRATHPRARAPRRPAPCLTADVTDRGQPGAWPGRPAERRARDFAGIVHAPDSSDDATLLTLTADLVTTSLAPEGARAGRPGRTVPGVRLFVVFSSVAGVSARGQAAYAAATRKKKISSLGAPQRACRRAPATEPRTGARGRGRPGQRVRVRTAKPSRGEDWLAQADEGGALFERFCRRPAHSSRRYARDLPRARRDRRAPRVAPARDWSASPGATGDGDITARVRAGPARTTSARLDGLPAQRRRPGDRRAVTTPRRGRERDRARC